MGDLPDLLRVELLDLQINISDPWVDLPDLMIGWLPDFMIDLT